MNIDISHYYGVHKGGTKDYHLYLISQSGGEIRAASLLVKRWGKTGATGQCKVEIVQGNGSGSLSAALRDREKSGYDMRHEQDSMNGVSVEQAMSLLPSAHARSVTNAQLAVLDPTRFSSTDRSPFDPLSAQRAQQTATIEAAAKASEEDEIEAFLKSNPNYGMF